MGWEVAVLLEDRHVIVLVLLFVPILSFSLRHAVQ